MLTDILESGHENLMWRAAEVVATCVQNNASVQQVHHILHRTAATDHTSSVLRRSLTKGSCPESCPLLRAHILFVD